MLGISQGISRLSDRRSVESYWDLLILLVQKDLKVRYKKNVLGYVWSIASPLTYALVYYFAFQVVLQVRAEGYGIILISGLFPWQWFANSMMASPNYFIATSQILRKVRFPLSIVPLAANLNNMIHFLLSLPVVLLMLFVYQRTPSWSWLYGVPLLVIVQMVMLQGISLIFSSLNLFLRDIERVAQVITQFTFFFTPIIYTVDMLPPKYLPFLPFNPAAPLMVNWRYLILDGTLDWGYYLCSVGYALLFLALGTWVFNKLSSRFAEVA
ncbi:MAG: ABC transporter permease [Cyanobacteria bacterium J06638_22]